MDDNRVWIVGFWLDAEIADGANWALDGVYDTRDKAEAGCQRDDHWFIASMPLNESDGLRIKYFVDFMYGNDIVEGAQE